ncbi:MAG: N-acetyltransferase family protein [Ramlibacter sp.]
MEIRRLTAADAVDYRALRLRALREHPEAFTSSWEEDADKPVSATQARLADARQTFWGAFERGALCGVVGLERLPRAKERHKGWVVGMYVAPEAAGHGCGAALLEALLAQASTEGLQDLLLTVTEGNDGALRCYRRAGFAPFGVEPRAVWVDGRFHGKVHMHLQLGHPWQDSQGGA